MQKPSGSLTTPKRIALIVFVVILLLLLVGWPASASSRALPTPLSAGQPAPFAGVLMPTERAIILGQKAERCEFLLEQQAATHKKMSDIDLRFVRKIHQIDLDAGAQREQVLRDIIDAERARAFWTHPIFVVPVTVVLTYAILRGAKELP